MSKELLSGWDLDSDFVRVIAAIGRGQLMSIEGIPEQVGELIQDVIMEKRPPQLYGLPFPAAELGGWEALNMVTTSYDEKGNIYQPPFSTEEQESFYLKEPNSVWDRVMSKDGYLYNGSTLARVRKNIDKFGLSTLLYTFRPGWLEVAKIHPQLYENHRVILGIVLINKTNLDYYGQEVNWGLLGIFTPFSYDQFCQQVKIVGKDLDRLDEIVED